VRSIKILVMLVYVKFPIVKNYGASYTYVAYLAIMYQFPLAVLLLLHRPHLRLTQKLCSNMKNVGYDNLVTPLFSVALR
jgi:hypothetical protein